LCLLLIKLMIVKRLGPSLVPAEIVIPLSTLGDVVSLVTQPMIDHLRGRK
jgi:hypothetical protein